MSLPAYHVLGLAVLSIVVLAAFLWLRQSPYWAGITLFSESHRVENLRAMDRVFRSRPIPRGATLLDFDVAPQPLPDSYDFAGVEAVLPAGDLFVGSDEEPALASPAANN